MRDQQQKFMEMMITKLASNSNTTPTTDVVKKGADGTPFDKDKYPPNANIVASEDLLLVI